MWYKRLFFTDIAESWLVTELISTAEREVTTVSNIIALEIKALGKIEGAVD